ncbi:MAG: hypothetical protein ACRD1N_09380 [Terriglobia bacterium]
MILLAAEDWQSRALLRAQLLEEGVEVEAHETVRDALSTVTNLNALPSLLVADLFASPSPGEDFRLLAKWTPLIPTWVILGHTVNAEDAQRAGAERILYRPVDMKWLVAEIKQRIA